MANNSATGGYLLPSSTPAPLEAQALRQFLQQIWVNITGLPGTLFFPRWQLEPENLPAVGVDWAAFGITDRKNNKFAFIRHVPAIGLAPAYDEFQTHEEMEILTSFYGPNGDFYASLLRDGLYISQNREPLLLNNMGLIDTGDIVTVPALIKEQWLYRYDLMVRIRRQIVRQYAIQDVDSVSLVVQYEQPGQEGATLLPIDISNPLIATLTGTLLEDVDLVTAAG